MLSETLKAFITRILGLTSANGRELTTLEQKTTGKQNQSNSTDFLKVPLYPSLEDVESDNYDDNYVYHTGVQDDEPREDVVRVLTGGVFRVPNPYPMTIMDGPYMGSPAHFNKWGQIEIAMPYTEYMSKKYLWEILVPTEWHDADAKGAIDWESELKPVRLRHHRIWDEQVIEITGGLTIIGKVAGRWVCKEGRKYEEGMIACRIQCTSAQIKEIADFTLKHYRQKAVMYYKISSESYIIERE